MLKLADLRDALNELSEEQLQQSATVFLAAEEEFLPVEKLVFAQEIPEAEDIVEPDQFVIVVYH